jgi:hypothetical protein
MGGQKAASRSRNPATHSRSRSLPRVQVHPTFLGIGVVLSPSLQGRPPGQCCAVVALVRAGGLRRATRAAEFLATQLRVAVLLAGTLAGLLAMSV